MTANKIYLKKDDKVKIITGKDRNKIGKIVRVIRKDSRVIVENINIIKKHSKPSATNRQGGIVEQEAPLHWSNVMLVCNKCLNAVRIKRKLFEDGKKVRVCSKCNEMIDV